MDSLSIGGKKKLLNLIKDIDGNITISSLKEYLELEISNDQDRLNKIDEDIIQEYSNTYLIIENDSGLFGSGLVLLHIRKIKLGGYTDTWEKTYACEHTKISFYPRDVSMFEYDDLGHINCSFTKSELDSYRKIDKDTFNKYMTRYNEIQSLLLSTITTDLR